jgi:hypothetical protein
MYLSAKAGKVAGVNEFAVRAILKRSKNGLCMDDQRMLESMAAYLDRNSLKIVGDNGGCGDGLEVRVSNDAERFLLTLPELRELWLGLKNGRAVDWSTLRRG